MCFPPGGLRAQQPAAPSDRDDDIGAGSSPGRFFGLKNGVWVHRRTRARHPIREDGGDRERVGAVRRAGPAQGKLQGLGCAASGLADSPNGRAQRARSSISPRWLAPSIAARGRSIIRPPMVLDAQITTRSMFPRPPGQGGNGITPELRAGIMAQFSSKQWPAAIAIRWAITRPEHPGKSRQGS